MEVEYSHNERTHKLMSGDVPYFKSLVNEMGIDKNLTGYDSDVLIDLLSFCSEDGPTRRIIMETLVVEHWNEFFISGGWDSVSSVHKEIVGQLLSSSHSSDDKLIIGRVLPPLESCSYTDFKLWIYSYLSNYIPPNYDAKIIALYFAKFHHCSGTRPKLNILLHMNDRGRTYILNAISDSCPYGVVSMNNSFYDNRCMKDRLLIFPGLEIGTAHNDDLRNNFKERATSGGNPYAARFYNDEETGERRMETLSVDVSHSSLATTRSDLVNADPNFLSRYIVMHDLCKVGYNQSTIGARPQDKTHLQTIGDLCKNEMVKKEHQEVHKVYYMMNDMLKKDVAKIGNLDTAQILINEVFDKSHNHNLSLINTNVRSRARVLEMCKCMALSYAVWYGLSAKETRHLQYDPVTGEFVGFNPRVIIDGILPRLVVTSEMVEDALSLLSCQWEK